MVSQITKGIKITVRTSFEGAYFKNMKIHFAFVYDISIENNSKETVQLHTRHWEIKDALNEIQFVDGEGVVGEQPIIRPGCTHRYQSGCLLTSPFGTMKGYFLMINLSDSKRFRVYIPAFKLCAPFALN